MLVFDSETTGLIKNKLLPLPQQPHIIEFAAVKLSDALEVSDKLTFMCNPGVPLDKVITDITGITEADLADKKPFSAYADEVSDFFLGERAMVAHNCAYDRDMLELELRRLGRVTRFPWPIQHVCTVEATHHLQGHRLKMTELYEVALGKPLAQTHRALDDVLALCDIVRWARGEGLL